MIERIKTRFFWFALALLTPMSVLETASIYSLYPIFSIIFENERDFSTFSTSGIPFIGSGLRSFVKLALMLFTLSIIFRILVFRRLFLKVQMIRVELTEYILSHLLRSVNRTSESLNESNYLSEIDLAVSNYFMPLLMVIFGVVNFVLLISLLFLVDALVTFYSLVFFSISLGVLWIITQGKLKEISDARLEANRQRFAYSSAIFRNIREICAGHRREFVSEQLATHSRELSVSVARAQLFGYAPRYLIETLTVVTFLTLILTLGAEGVEGALISTLALFVVVAIRLLPSIQAVINFYTQFKISDPVFKEMTLLEAATEEIEPRGPIHTETVTGEHGGVWRVLLSGYVPRFASEASDESITFEFRTGELNWIVGESGSGKTSLCDAITMMVPSEPGVISLRDRRDREIKPSSIRAGYLAQQPEIYDGSLELNVYGEDFSRDDFERLSSNLGLERALRRFETGRPNPALLLQADSISVGETQRLCMIRLVLQKHDFYIFDEPTSGLDEANTLRVIEFLKGFAVSNLLIVITHDTALIDGEANVLRLGKTLDEH